MQGMPVICLPTGTRYVIQSDFHWWYDILTGNARYACNMSAYWNQVHNSIGLPLVIWYSNKQPWLLISEHNLLHHSLMKNAPNHQSIRKKREKKKKKKKHYWENKTARKPLVKELADMLVSCFQKHQAFDSMVTMVDGGCPTPVSAALRTSTLPCCYSLSTNGGLTTKSQVTSTTHNTQNIKSNCAKFTRYWLVLLLYKSRTPKALKAQDKQSKIQCELHYKIHK